jgi:hypothetical protein
MTIQPNPSRFSHVLRRSRSVHEAAATDHAFVHRRLIHRLDILRLEAAGYPAIVQQRTACLDLDVGCRVDDADVAVVGPDAARDGFQCRL